MNNKGFTGWFTTIVLLLCLLVNTVSLEAQNIDLNNRPVAKIELVGVKPESQQLVRNQIRLAEGQAYDEEVEAFEDGAADGREDVDKSPETVARARPEKKTTGDGCDEDHRSRLLSKPSDHFVRL